MRGMIDPMTLEELKIDYIDNDVGKFLDRKRKRRRWGLKSTNKPFIKLPSKGLKWLDVKYKTKAKKFLILRKLGSLRN